MEELAINDNFSYLLMIFLLLQKLLTYFLNNYDIN